MLNDVTWHDQKPTHPIKPEWLLEAEEENMIAQSNLDRHIDECLEAGEWDDFKLGELTVLANHAYFYLLECRNRWLNRDVEVGYEVTAFYREGAEV